jgi:iron complex outermembrane receptor protein
MRQQRWRCALSWLLGSAIILSAAGAWAADPPPSESDRQGVFDLGEVVVKGKAETISAVSTVDEVSAERIEENNARNVSDALDTLPGVYLSVGAKNERNIIIRGFNERYVPVFLDGIPLYIPNDGYVDTGNLPTNNISKLTLSKGVASVLYGPNTMAGVINLVTKKPEKPFEAGLTAEFVEDSTWNINADIGSRLDKFYVMVNGGYTDSDGFLMSDDFTPAANEDGGVRNNSDITDTNWSAKVGFLPADGHEYALGIQRVDREKGLPPHVSDSSARYWRFTDWEKTTYYAIGNSRFTDAFSTKVRIFHDEYCNVLDSYDDDTYTSQTRGYAFHSTYDDYSNGLSLVMRSEHIARNILSFSFHYKEDVHEEQDDTGDLWERYEQKTYSYGLEDDFKISDKLAVVAGASYDINDPTYSNGLPLRDDVTVFNPQAGVLWTLGQDWDLHFSVGRKTRFPTLHEMFATTPDGMNLGNTDLHEEKAVNWELGVAKPLPGQTQASFALFYSDIENLIVRKNLGGGFRQYQNIGKARYQGFEVGLGTQLLPRNRLEMHYTYLDAENRSPERTSDYIEEQSEHKLYVSDRVTITDWLSFYAKAEYNSDRYEEDWGSGEWKTLDGFWLVDAKLIFTPKENIALEAGFKNLLDENYQLSDGYPREGRAYFVTAKVTY